MKSIFISAEIKAVQISFITKAFGWLSVGFFIGGFIAFKLSQNFYLIQLLSNYIALGILVIIQLALVIWLSINIEKMPSNQVTLYFIGFSVLNGITIPSIFRLFTQNSFGNSFFILGAMFMIMFTFGYLTKRDLTAWSSLVLMIFVAMGLNIFVNIFWRNEQFQLIASGVAIFVFLGLIIYDTSRIKEMSLSDLHKNPSACLGAFVLYLDLYYLLISMVLEENKGRRRING